MSWSQEGDEIVLRMSRDTWGRLVFALGYAAGAALRENNEAFYRDALRLMNTLNEGNPNFTVYAVSPEAGATV